MLYPYRDPRSNRPLASEVLLTFWKHVIGQPVRSLRGVMFHFVEESTTIDVRQHVYRALHQMRSAPLSLNRHGDESEMIEFDRVRKDSKLGRCVDTMTTQYIEMKGVRARIEQFNFIPEGRRGESFHLEVIIEHGREADG